MHIFLGKPSASIEAWIKGQPIPPPPPLKLGPLCFTAEEANARIVLYSDSDWTEDCNYIEVSMDGKTWTKYDGHIIWLANVGDKVYFNTPEGITNHAWGYTYDFDINYGKIAASGNIMSLVVKDGLTNAIPNEQYYFTSLFEACSELTQAPELPATTLAEYCYTGMFNNCTSLSAAPELPATTLAEQCYQNMFENCTSLTTAPELSATTLAVGCYSHMFDGCASLTTAPELSATTLAVDCYNGMFAYCTSLTQAPVLPATTLAYRCYYSLFQNCTSLAQAPTLPATTLADYCYYDMFKNCTKFSDCHMKASMEGVYNKVTHGDTKKTVIYDL